MKKTKIIILVSTVAIIGIPLVLFIMKEAAVRDKFIAEDLYSEEETAVVKTNDKLSSEKKERSSLRKRLDKTIQREQALNAELERYDDEIMSGEERVIILEGEVTPIKENLELIAPNITELKKRVANIIKDNLKLAEEFALLKKTTAALMKRLKEYTDKQRARERGPVTTLPSIISSTEILSSTTASSSKPQLTGEVLTVNREFDFIVVSLGRTKDIEEGMILDVMRDGKRLTQVTVETVRENISAAALIDKENILQIRAGDKVYLQ